MTVYCSNMKISYDRKALIGTLRVIMFDKF